MKAEPYYKEMSSLRTAKKDGVKAPHKPILLLSIIDLIERGLITNKHIELSDSLIRTFDYNWCKYVGHSKLYNSVIGTPFWHMQNESFWKLVSYNGTEVTKENVSGGKIFCRQFT